MTGVEAPSAAERESPQRLLILSDIRLYREGLAQLVDQALPNVHVRTAASAELARTQMEEEPAEVLLIDLATEGVLEAARRLHARYPRSKLIGLGVEDEPLEVPACAEAGLCGFVCRSAGLEELLDALRGAAAGELRCSSRVAGALVARLATLARTAAPDPEASHLTRREIQVLRLVDEGLTNKEIAKRLHISTSTARNHVHNILERLGVSTRTRAAAVARHLLV